MFRRPETAEPTRRAVAALLLTITLLAAGGPADARRIGPATPPHPTTAGQFEGTWSRADPIQQQALMIRREPEGDRWQLRLQWVTKEGFVVDTDWNGRAEYTLDGYPGSLELAIDHERSSDARIVATWHREQEGARSSRIVETGDVALYRTGRSGRELVWAQEELRREINIGEPLFPEEESIEPQIDQVIYLFSKQSVRVLQWDEIYW